MTEKDTLFYSEEYQVKVLGYMLQNPQFTSIARETIEIEHFANFPAADFRQTREIDRHHPVHCVKVSSSCMTLSSISGNSSVEERKGISETSQ